MTARRRRLGAALVAAATVAAGLCVHLFAPDGVPSDVAGDVLYAVLVYVLVVVVVPRRPVWVPALCAWGWCIAVELFQLSGLPVAWGREFPPVMLVLGTVFDARDLLVYTAAIVVSAGADRLIRRG